MNIMALAIVGLIVGIATLAYAIIAPGVQMAESLIGGFLIGYCGAHVFYSYQKQ